MRWKVVIIGVILGLGVAGIYFGVGQADIQSYIMNETESKLEKTDSDEDVKFSEVSREIGITPIQDHRLKGDKEDVAVPYAGHGVYAVDYNRDSWTDLLVLTNGVLLMYQNKKSEFAYSDVLPKLDHSVSAAIVFDHDRDGLPDIITLMKNKTPLLLENNGYTFQKRPGVFDEALENPVGGTVADYNHDGCLDLFVIQNGDWLTTLPDGFRNYSASLTKDNGAPNYLYEGDCSSFRRLNHTTIGIQGTRWSLATSFADLSGDDLPDIHVANDFNRDIIYYNRGDHFEQTVLSERTNRNGMASELTDINGDGLLDIFVTNIYYPRWAAVKINPSLLEKAGGNNLLIKQKNGSYIDKADKFGVQSGGWGWAAVIEDLDNDGDQDILHTTKEMTFRDMKGTFTKSELEQLQANTFYSTPAVWEQKNDSFVYRSSLSNSFMEANGRGMASLDYDNDGSMEFVIAATDGIFAYRNTASVGNSIQIRLETKNGSIAHGADVFIKTDRWTQWEQLSSQTDFLSQDTRILHFGVGNVDKIDLQIERRNGIKQIFENVRTNQRLIITPAGINRTISLAS